MTNQDAGGGGLKSLIFVSRNMWMARRAPKKLDAINVGCALLFLYSDLPSFFWMTFLLHPPNALVFFETSFVLLFTHFFHQKGVFRFPLSFRTLFTFFFFLVLRGCPPSFFPPPLLLLCRLLLVFSNDKYNGFGQGSVDVFG